MDKKSLLAVGLSLLILAVWQKFYLEPIQIRAAQEQRMRQEEQAKTAELPKGATGAQKTGAEAMPTKASVALPVDKVVKANLDNGDSAVVVSNEAWALSGWELKSISRSLQHKEEKVTLVDGTGFSQQLRVRFSDPALTQISGQNWRGIEKKGERKVGSILQTDALKAQRSFELDQTGYGGKVEYRFQFSNEPPKFIFLDLIGSSKRANDQEGSIFGQAPDKVHLTFRDHTGRHSVMGASLKETKESDAGVKWLGLDTRYFVLALVPTAEGGADFGAQATHEDPGASSVRGSLVFPTGGKKDVNFSAKVYFGPKEMSSLTRVDPVLSDAIDFGWTSFIAVPLLQALKWLYSYVKNYGLAIIALTFLIKMLLFPLMYKSMKSMAKMSKLQPQLNALREKYKDDREKLNVEMMNFMKANGYNPVGGCLPILLQMPIFFALYRVLFNSMELYQAPFAGWIHDLSSPDPFYVTPILLAGLMYLQQKLSPNTAADPAQQKMLQIMPLMFGAFMLMLPSGLTIYMVVNSITSIGQQYYLNRKLGIKPAPAKIAAKA